MSLGARPDPKVIDKELDSLVRHIRSRGARGEEPLTLAMIGYGDLEIDLALKYGLIEQVNGKYYAVVVETTPVAVATLAQPEPVTTINSKAPILPGCKCRNSDQLTPEYWLFTGQQAEIQAAQIELERLGINAHAKANGVAGVWKLILPKWVTGELKPGAEVRWREDKGEEYVINSYGTSIESTPSSEAAF